ncbi:g982 [Coccomyxa elongata]
MPPRKIKRSKKVRSGQSARRRRTTGRSRTSRRQSGAGLLTWMRRFLGPRDEQDNFEGRLPVPAPYMGAPGGMSYTAMPPPPQMTMPPNSVQALTPLQDVTQTEPIVAPRGSVKKAQMTMPPNSIQAVTPLQDVTQSGPIVSPRGSAKKAQPPTFTAGGGMRKNRSRNNPKPSKGR